MLFGAEVGDAVGIVGGPIGMAIGTAAGATIGAAIGGIGYLFSHIGGHHEPSQQQQLEARAQRQRVERQAYRHIEMRGTPFGAGPHGNPLG